MGGLLITGTVSMSSSSLQGLRQQAITERRLLQRERDADVVRLLADRTCCGCIRWFELELELDALIACTALSISVILKHISVARMRRSISNVRSKRGRNREEEEDDMTPMPSMKCRACWNLCIGAPTLILRCGVVEEEAGLRGEETSVDESILPREERNQAPLLLLVSVPPVAASAVQSDVLLTARTPIWRDELFILAVIADSQMS